MFQIVALGAVSLGILAAGAAYAQSQKVEVPAYSVDLRDGDFELRSYPELTLAQVTRPGSRRGAVQSAFSPLARYIFARDRPGAKIAMTAPVVQEPINDGWVVSFIMPAGLTLEALPAPVGEVRLTTEPARRMVAIRFSGSWTDARFNAATRRLTAWADAQGLTVTGAPEYGYYNDPFTPAFLRRNEVLIPVAPRER